MSACRANSLRATAATCAWMSKCRNAVSALACPAPMVRARQGSIISSRISPPPTRSALANRHGAKGLAIKRRFARKKALLAGSSRIQTIVRREANGAVDRSATRVDVYETVRGTTDRYRQRGLKAIEESLQVIRPESSAYRQVGNPWIADHDSSIGVALDFGNRFGQGLPVENNRTFAPREIARQLRCTDRYDGIVRSGRGELLPGAHRSNYCSGTAAAGVRGRRLKSRGLGLNLDATFGYHDLHMLISVQADLEFGADRPHHRITCVNEEWSQAIVGYGKVRLTLAQIDLPHAAPHVRLHDRVGVERDDRTVGQRDIAVLTHGRGQGLDLAAFAQPVSACDGEQEQRGGGQPPKAVIAQGRTPGGRDEGGNLLAPVHLGKAIQGAPDLGQLLYRTPVARVLAQPGLESLALRATCRG